MNPDFKELLQLFNVNRVEYLMIGGYVVIEYTEFDNNQTRRRASTGFA